MLKRWSKALIRLGIALMVSGAALLYLRFKTELKFVDLTSGNPHWHRPAATTFDLFVLSFPAASLTVGGAIVLMAGWLARRRSDPAGRQ
jgi:hypothetical protein